MADSFLENPFVSAVGSAVGLDPLMAAASSSAPPPQQVPPPQAPPTMAVMGKPEIPASRLTGARERQQVDQRYPKGSSATRGSMPGVSGMGMNMPGVMSPDVLMHPAVQQLLSQYGVSPEQATAAAQGASPNLFITNPAAYQKHPVLSGLLERGLEGAAFTKGSHTWGEGISNVAQGMLDANGARADKYNNQLMMPFAQASQVAGLQNTNDEQKFKVAQAQHYQDLEDHYQNMDQTNQMYKEGLIDMKGVMARLKDIEDQRKKNEENVKNLFNPALEGLEGPDKDAFNEELTAAGGDIFALPPSRLEMYAQKGKASLDAKVQAGKMAVAGVTASTRNNATNAGAGEHDATLELSAANDNLRTAEANYKAFVADVASGRAVVRGQKYYSADPEVEKEEGRLKGLVDDAQGKIADIGRRAQSRQLSMPGVLPNSNPAPKQPRMRTMNMDGTIQ